MSPSADSASSVVLDTNVIAELMKADPDPAVRRWVFRTDPQSIHTTAVTVAEVRFGIARLPDGRRRAALRAAADDVFNAYSERVLAFDADAAVHYADIVVERQRAGAPIAGFDAQIAAICRSHGATLVTRNTEDFTGLQLAVLDPWQATE